MSEPLTCIVGQVSKAGRIGYWYWLEKRQVHNLGLVDYLSREWRPTQNWANKACRRALARDNKQRSRVKTVQTIRLDSDA